MPDLMSTADLLPDGRPGLPPLPSLPMDRPMAPPAADEEWFANLIEGWAPEERQALAREIWAEVESAEQSRKHWLDLLGDGLTRLGIDRTERTRDVPFQGASAVRHSMLMQAVVEFSSRSMSELCPPGGPAKGVILAALPDPEGDLQERADRRAAFVNWQCTEWLREFEVEQDRMLMMLALEGSSFTKLWWDPTWKRARYSYVPSTHVIMPYHAADEMTAPLLAHKLELFPSQARANIAAGLWLEHDIAAMPPAPPSDRAREATDRSTGLSSGAGDIIAHQPVLYYETAVRRLIPGLEAEGEAEFLVTVLDGGRDIVAVRRNWREDDPARARVRQLYHWRMFPWQGVYGIGFLHLIGGLSDAATGSLRALLDSATIVNSPGGFALKRGAAGSARDRGPITRRPGEYVEVDAPGVDDVRKVITADPFPGPSPVLFELMGAMVDSGRNFASVALQELAESTGNVPVGTTLARVEEGSRIYAQVYARLHRTMHQVLRGLDALNLEHIDAEWLGRNFVAPPLELPDDMDPRVSVSVVSDPRTFSHVQRVMHGQLARELVGQAKDMGVECDARLAFVMAAKAVGLPNADKLFPEPDEPVHHESPLVENAACMKGLPIRMEQTDDHQAHLIAHLLVLQLSGVLASPNGQQLVEHVFEHAAFLTDMNAYGSVIQQLKPAFESADPKGVAQLAAVEQAKVDAGKEETAAKLMADQQRIQAKLESDLEVVRAELNAKLIEISAQMQGKREGFASAERIASAQLSGKVEMDAAKRVGDQHQRELDRQQNAQDRERDRQLGIATGVLDHAASAAEGERVRAHASAESHADRQHAAGQADKTRALDFLQQGHDAARGDIEREQAQADAAQQRQHTAGEAEKDRKAALAQVKLKTPRPARGRAKGS